jgi:hypothetical protein
MMYGTTSPNEAVAKSVFKAIQQLKKLEIARAFRTEFSPILCFATSSTGLYALAAYAAGGPCG